MFSLCEATKMVSSQAPLWRSLNCSRARRDAGAWVRAGWLVSGQSLFRSAQPRKLCVEDGNGFGGGFPGCHPWRDGFASRRHKGPAGSLVAGMSSATTRSQAA